MEKIGADAVIVEGMESGGHVGTLTTMALLPQIVNVLSIPVIAAGGIASGKTIFSCTFYGSRCCPMWNYILDSKRMFNSQNYKNIILKAKDRSTVVNRNFNRAPCKSYR